MTLTQEQLLKDLEKQAKDFANEKGIVDSLTISYIMEAINMGMQRGLEIAKALNNEPSKPTEEELEALQADMEDNIAGGN